MKKKIPLSILILLVSLQVQAKEATAPTTQATPMTQTNTQPSTTQPTTQSVINCDYKIPAETKKIEQSLINTWAEKALVQSFELDHNSLDQQMQKLQACFTEQGWQGFNAALQKSGNLEAIKSQKLNVSSQVDGKIEMLENKDNQWKIALPLQVVYQNEKEKVTQLLNINLTIGRKTKGDLGIMQLIATPRNESTPKQAKSTAPSAPATSNNEAKSAPANNTASQSTKPKKLSTNADSNQPSTAL